MKIDEVTVTKIAKLSRIKIRDEEKSHYARELSSIMSFIEQLGEVSTDGVPEMASVANVTLPMREDKVTDGDITKQILANSPKSDFDCFVVPKVVDQG